MALDALGDPKEAGDMLMAGVIYISRWLLTATIQNRDLASNIFILISPRNENLSIQNWIFT
jgi:hypothetical protein